jgi:hypothetical protein
MLGEYIIIAAQTDRIISKVLLSCSVALAGVKDNRSFIIDEKTIAVSGITYNITASMHCGSDVDVVIINIFQEGSIYKIDRKFTLYPRSAYKYYTMYFNKGRYLYLQLSYATKPYCNHSKYIESLAEKFIFIALRGIYCLFKNRYISTVGRVRAFHVGSY